MFPALTLDSILERADLFALDRESKDRLVSVVFSPPRQYAIKDLSRNRVIWDAETGNSWDLFFAGYYRYGFEYHDADGTPAFGRTGSREGDWWFGPNHFRALIDSIEVEHRNALAAVVPTGRRWLFGRRQRPAVPGRRGGPAWRYTGTTDLVSFMVYGGRPDWLSLRAAQLVDSNDRYFDGYSLGEVVAELRHWEAEDISDDFAPGYPYRGTPYIFEGRLVRALAWSAGAIGAGVLGNMGYDIVQHALK